jgi:hypothetical protein
MGRIPRRNQWAEEACCHLMNRGHNREAIFLDDENRHAFLGLVDRYRKRFDVAQTINSSSPVQFWFGVRVPF